MNKAPRHFRVCRACGFPLANDEMAWLFRGKQRKIFELIAAAGNAGISREALVERIYIDHPNGGPLSARGSIAVMINQQMNPRLVPFGLTIKGRSGRGSWPYHLTTLTTKPPFRQLPKPLQMRLARERANVRRP